MINTLVGAETMVGVDGHRSPALSNDAILELFDHAHGGIERA